MSVIIATRAFNDELRALSYSLVEPPFPRVPIKGTGALDYYYALIGLEADWVINIDEDAFLWSFAPIERLLHFMQENGFHCCGMPDGGVIGHRSFSPVAVNAFFNILNVAALRTAFSVPAVEASVFEGELQKFIPKHLMHTDKFQFTDYEPYYKFFYWLLKSDFKMLYLDAVQWKRDPISTILLDNNRQPLLLHTWYGRAFAEQRARIEQAYAHCKTLQQKSATKGST